MTPVPQEPVQHERPVRDRVVISGMSGLYPNAHNVEEFADILYNKVNPVSDDHKRWSYQHPEASQHIGAVPDLHLFDSQFFKVHRKLGLNMDPMSRKILEESYKAIYDAGLSPEHLSGKKIGVYIGTCFSETEKACFYVASIRTGFGIPGCSKTMFANRISYWLNGKGPSHAIDQSCCSSTAAVEEAYKSIIRGECEAAIAGGCSLCLHPQSSIHYRKITKLSNDGRTKSYDQNAEGFARSDAIGVLFLQKAQDALRIYAEVVHIKNSFLGTKEGTIGPKFGFDRDSVKMANFIKKVYDECHIPPSVVEYVEGFGSADPDADKSELEALAAVFKRDKEDPLLIGSVMSNVGYTEAGSGVTAITKVLLGYHKGELAGNLNFETPRQDVEAMRDGRLKVLSDHHKFRRSYVAINGLSTMGVNSHVVLHGNYKPKDLKRYKSRIPRLVTMSGRTDSAVSEMVAQLKSKPVDPEQLALLHNIHTKAISGHLGRGYMIFDNEKDETVCLSEKVDYYDDAKRPLVFVYSGMGSQWAGMGAQLMRIPIFSAAIERCDRVLRLKGLDIVDIITSPEKTTFNNILHSFVGIAAVQIGLTDVLKAIGLEPDFIIGHSVGELGCAYADGCFTAEEMILSAYSRGLVSLQTPFIKGSMAAVGIGYQKIKDMCPPEIEVACHNGPDSCTISGPQDVMKEFVAKLTDEQIFAKEVPCSNIAYHSRYIAEAGPALRQYLSDVIKSPKARSERWLSSSVPVDKWDQPLAKMSSAEYHTNNLLSPVLFEETSQLLPKNGVMVEIAPHGLLQAILKRSMPDTCTQISMTRRDSPDNVLNVLNAIGKLYVIGYVPNVSILYPKVEFPVSTGTPFLSNLVHWMHSEKWSISLYMSPHRNKVASCTFPISIHDDDYSFLRGNVIRGKILYPYAAALVAVWDTLAMTTEQKKKQFSVQFSDVHLYAQPILHDRRAFKIQINLHRGTGMFEVLDGDCVVATGYIVGKIVPVKKNVVRQIPEYKGIYLQSKEVYQRLQKRNYTYSGEFQSISEMSENGSKARIFWNNNWTTFIDGLLQLQVLNREYDGVSEVEVIRSMSIDIKDHPKNFIYIDKLCLLEADFVRHYDMLCCGGIMIESVMFRDVPLITQNISLKSFKFVPRHRGESEVTETLQVYHQIILENINKTCLNVVNIVNVSDLALSNKIEQILRGGTHSKLRFINVNTETIKSCSTIDVLIVKNLAMDETIIRLLHDTLPQNTFIINIEDNYSISKMRPSNLYKVVASSNHKDMRSQLIRWRPLVPQSGVTTITVRNSSDLPLLSSSRANLHTGHTLVILTSYPQIPGLKDLVAAWRKDEDRNQIYLIALNQAAENQDLMQLPDLDLAFNILNNGVWGGEYSLPCNVSSASTGVVKLQSPRLGDMNLTWVEQPSLNGPGIPVTVHYCSLNHRDAKQALGVSKDDVDIRSYAMEFSGVTDSGERVMGLVPSGAASSRVLAIPELLWPVPEHWTLEDAATVPLAYALIIYILYVKGATCNIRRLFVHCGAGGLGQAAINVALAHDMHVLTTVGSLKKKEFLLKLFPKLNAEDIGNSRDHTFADMVRTRTNGKNCDIAINSLEGALKNATLKTSGIYGYAFDFSQISNAEDYAFGMDNLTLNRSYIIMDASTLFAKKKVAEIVQTILADGISRGFVIPLTRVVFGPQEAARALKLIVTGNNYGRVLLNMRDIDVQAQPRIACSPEHCHLVVTDDYSCGVQWIKRLVDRGAKSGLIKWINLDVNRGVDMTSTKGVLGLLNDCIKAGPVEGIYMISANGKISQKTVDYLDVISRKSCPGLKYFAILSDDNALGQKNCSSRAHDKLPAIKLILPTFSKTNSISNSHMDGIERAMRSKGTVLLIDTQEVGESSMLDRIASIAEIQIPPDVDGNTTLEALGLKDMKVKAIHKYIRDTYSFYIHEEKIKSLSIDRLKQYESEVTESEYEEVEGMENFFFNVDSDELLATTEMVFLTTMSNTSAMRGDEFNLNDTYLCIVPGLEGHNKRFITLCQWLKLPALVLQPGLDHLEETIPEVARRYAETLMNKIGLKSYFYLMGYESGVLVALEIAAILEQNGMTGTVYCIGATPKDFKATLEKKLKKYKTEDDLQDAVVQHMFTIMGGDVKHLIDLNKCSSWDEKVQASVRTLVGQVPHSAQYAKALIKAAYSRIHQVRNYEIKPFCLQSQLILIRAFEQPDSNLEMYSKKPVIVYDLKAPLSNAAADLRCSSIINRHLDKHLLEAFNEKNICDTYITNSDTFMQHDQS
ncbi:fatty acid synthase-like [Plodia interpunctella]|uniref:fatty acid synthase-like n=1 Tax=Plodia interpunctella TaxID=58824 RepID=UPI0023675271|nr:fatty acid synthase-like [Plodia interpunctella]XP_053617683.1 fatty acid synthase-like [Plodia interpunctella]